LDALPGVWLPEPSLRLPLFSHFGSPVAEGIAVAALVALCLGLALRLVALPWAGLAAALAAALLTSPLAIAPWAAGVGVNIVFAWALVVVCQRFGLTALLVSSVTSFLLPAAVFTGLHLPWTTASFVIAGALAAAIPLAGLAGLSRSAAAELARMEPPAFVRRLEEDKRRRHEMGLLARMQQGLLPRRLPEVPGWEIAARSVIANEAGGDLYDMITDQRGLLWIAAGDVAGHGYSCAVAQAMTKSALASLIGRYRSPAEVLARADRVLRTAGPTRHFTTLALLRLDPQTGDGVFCNAGHPPAYLVDGDGVRELAVAGLPLGMGPTRSYGEISLTLTPGASLVFASDGLFEALDVDAGVYGFPRLAELLPGVSWRTADRILAAVFDDWRSHLRTLLPRDDTTVVVLKRKAGIG
jgi:serine phosphatase RsbU (regulator of sigma subunit)